MTSWSVIREVCYLMALVLAYNAFMYVYFDILMMIVDGFLRCFLHVFCQLELIHQTLKGQRYESNTERTNFWIIFTSIICFTFV